MSFEIGATVCNHNSIVWRSILVTITNNGLLTMYERNYGKRPLVRNARAFSTDHGLPRTRREQRIRELQNKTHLALFVRNSFLARTKISADGFERSANARKKQKHLDEQYYLYEHA